MDSPTVRFTVTLSETALIEEALENLHAVTKAQHAASSSPRERSDLTAKISQITGLRGGFRGIRRG